MSAFEAGEQRNLVTADEIAVAECYSMQDTAVAVFNGWTTDATRYIRIYTLTSERHDGKYNTSKYRLEIPEQNVAAALEIRENYVRVDGLQITIESAAENIIAIYVSGLSAANDIRISNNILKGVLSDTASACYGVLSDDADAIIKIWNNIAYDWIIGTRLIVGFFLFNGSTSDLYNNTAHNCRFGYYQSSGTVNATNCGAANCDTGFFGTINQTTNSTSTPTFEDEGADDFHLASGDTTWKDQGTDDPGSGLFSDDIDGETRVSTWDIGADEFVAVGVGLSIPVAMHHYRSLRS